MNNSILRTLFRRGMTGFVIFCLVITAGSFPCYASSDAGSSQYDKVVSAALAVEEAEEAVVDAEERYEKALNGDESASDEDLEYIGWEFLDLMVETAYDIDKEEISSSKLVPLSKLTVQGNIDKAYKISSCRSAIKSFNRSKSASKTFEGRLKRSLSIKNINKAIDLIEKCNKYRKNRGLKPYRISPYLMAGAAVSGLITYKNGSHSYPHSGKFTTVNGTKVSENYAWGYSNPFYIWYTIESQRAAAGQGGTSHFRAIISRKYVQTGAMWYDKAKLGAQCFTKSSAGTSYTPKEFRKLFNEFVEKRKEEISGDKKLLLTGTQEPSYLVKAREDLEKANKKYIKALKAYKADFTAVNYNYRTVKVKFKIPAIFQGIEIFRSKEGPDSGFKLIKRSSKGTYYYDSNQTAGKTLYYKIRFYRSVNGERIYSDYSDVLSATPKPSMVRDVSISSNSETNKFKLSWLSMHGATNYQIFAKKDGTNGFKRLKPGVEVNGLTLQESNDPQAAHAVVIASESGTYKFKIRAVTETEETKSYGTFSKILKATV